MTEPEHDPSCKWERGGEPCRRFSTDGTRLGADIAHRFGTTDEAKIVQAPGGYRFRTQVDEEQAEWDGSCPDWCIHGEAVIHHRCERDPHEPAPYPSSGLEWTEPRLPGTTQA